VFSSGCPVGTGCGGSRPKAWTRPRSISAENAALVFQSNLFAPLDLHDSTIVHDDFDGTELKPSEGAHDPLPERVGLCAVPFRGEIVD
jgi:hypothetical protein